MRNNASRLPASHRALAERIVAIWARTGGAQIPVVQLVGGDDEAKRRIATAACDAVDATLYALSSHALSDAPISGLVLGYGRLHESAIPAAVHELALVLRELSPRGTGRA